MLCLRSSFRVDRCLAVRRETVRSYPLRPVWTRRRPTPHVVHDFLPPLPRHERRLSNEQGFIILIALVMVVMIVSSVTRR